MKKATTEAKAIASDIIREQDLTLVHTGKSGDEYVLTHRVWNAARFLNSQMEEARKAGGKAAVRIAT